MSTEPRIGLIIPSSNSLTEPQFHRYLPPEVSASYRPPAHGRKVSQAA